jgi:hypothetical protein
MDPFDAPTGRVRKRYCVSAKEADQKNTRRLSELTRKAARLDPVAKSIIMRITASCDRLQNFA